jgi:hypothetical protein
MASEERELEEPENTEKRRLEVYPPIYKLGRVGKWIRGQLLKGKYRRLFE